MPSLLEICKEVSRRTGLTVLTSIVGNINNPQAVSYFGLAKEELKDIRTFHEWEQLRKEHTFITTATEAQTDGLASDIDRVVPNTFWNRTERNQIHGPINPREWQRIQATITNPTLDQFTIRDGVMYVTPTPDAGETWAYEYLSKNLVEDEEGNEKETFTLDTDIPKLDCEIIIRGLIWRYRNSKGLSYAQQYQDWRTYLLQTISQQKGGNENLNLLDNRGGRGIYIDEGAWNL
jgi:hypothetical protein